MIQFTVPGQPQGKGRPRFSRAGGFVRTYTPAATRSYEDAIRIAAVRAGAEVMTGPLRMKIYACRQVPASASKREVSELLAGMAYCTTRPDWDNLGKICSDALNGVCYEDDSQIVDARVVKQWAFEASVTVIIEAAS